MTIALRQPSSGRAASAAFALSLAVHGALVAALLLFARDVPSPFDPRVIEVALAAPVAPAVEAPAQPNAVATADDARASAPPKPRRAEPVPVIATRAPSLDVAPEATNARAEPVPDALVSTAPVHADAAPVAAADTAATDAQTDAQRGFVELHVLDWLSQHRRYPRAAARARLEGVVHVSFKLIPDGTIVDTRLEDSSGTRILDGAALELLERASPIPGVARFAMTRPIELRLPIQYRLRRTTKA